MYETYVYPVLNDSAFCSHFVLFFFSNVNFFQGVRYQIKTLILGVVTEFPADLLTLETVHSLLTKYNAYCAVHVHEENIEMKNIFNV